MWVSDAPFWAAMGAPETVQRELFVHDSSPIWQCSLSSRSQGLCANPYWCPTGHFDYQYGYRKFEGSDGSRTQKYASNITYYFDNISSAELYSVDQELLKDYIKRQM